MAEQMLDRNPRARGTRSFITVLMILPCITSMIPTVRAEEASPEKRPPIRILVPAYFYPAGEGLETWNRMIASHDPKQNMQIVAIANVNSGNVGTTIDPNYADVIRRASEKGLTVIAYITSDYANRSGNASLEAAKTNVTNWFKLYPGLKGVFIDEQTSDAAPIAAYYQPLRNHINSVHRNALVIGNPGNNCVEDYVAARAGGPIMDVVIIHENNETKLPYSTVQPAPWMAQYSPDRFAVLVHTSTNFARQIRLARSRRVGYVFVTDAVGPPPDSIHPWGKLPTYWDDELQMIGALNETVAPTAK